MMFLVTGLFVVFTLVVSCDSLCIPGTVPAVTLHSNYTLTWMQAYNKNNCNITNYVINIFDGEDGAQLQFETNSSTLKFNVSFLDMCTTYTFELHALTSEAVLGPSYQYVATTSPGSSMDLGLASINVAAVNKEIVLRWALRAPQSRKCVSYYRVVHWDDRNDPQDIYVTSTNFTLNDRIPCANYTFQVNAIVANPDLQGPVSEVLTKGAGEVPNVPTLVSLSTTNSSVNMIWKLQPYIQNSCLFYRLIVNTLGAPAGSSQVYYYISDNIMRPNINVTINNLYPNRVYTSYVYVLNNIGLSTNVTVTYQTPQQ